MRLTGVCLLMLGVCFVCADEKAKVELGVWSDLEVPGSATMERGEPFVHGRSLYKKEASQSDSEVPGSEGSGIKDHWEPSVQGRSLYGKKASSDSEVPAKKGGAQFFPGRSRHIKKQDSGRSTMRNDMEPQPQARELATSFSTSRHRGSSTPILGNENPAFYNYVPSTILDGLYRTWWCSNCYTCKEPGDHIYYSEAAGPGGPYGAKSIVFYPSGDYSKFDGYHTCDPNVVFAKGVHYLYYGGCCGTDPYHETAIGVAVSKDGGKTFTRMNNGNPIIESAKAGRRGSTYGAGQPSVIFKDDWFYMVYTDVSSRKQIDANFLFVTRSKDPTFQTGREEWQYGKFVPYDPATTTRDAFQDGASAAWMYSDVWDAFILAVDGTNRDCTTLTLWKNDLSSSFATLELPGSWTEGPGLVTKPNGHAPPSKDALSTVPIDSLRSVGQWLQPFYWQLASNGMDVKWSKVDDSQVDVATLFDGILLHCPGLPAAFITGGKRIQFESSGPLKYLSATTQQVSSAVYHKIPFGASVYKKDVALSAPGRPGAFLLNDGKLWPIGCIGIVIDNESKMVEVRTETWDKFQQGLPLFCMHP